MRVFKGGFYPTPIFLGAYSGDFGARGFLFAGYRVDLGMIQQGVKKYDNI